MRILLFCGLAFAMLNTVQAQTIEDAIAEREAQLVQLQTSLSRLYYQQGETAFFDQKFARAVAAWDREIELHPARLPHHWQRGLVLYYLNRFEDGAKQFEDHQVVNGTDVENAAWHFLCLSRHKDPKLAATKLYPYAGDRRKPMQEIHALFADSGSEQQVLDACRERNDFCYGHLYIGLHHEAHGRDAQALPHFKKAAVDFKMDHYMGKLAQIHYALRKDK